MNIEIYFLWQIIHYQIHYQRLLGKNLKLSYAITHVQNRLPCNSSSMITQYIWVS